MAGSTVQPACASPRVRDAAGPRSVAALVAALAGPLAAGCGDERACDHVVCSIDEASCVERIAEVVGCRLERPTLVPSVRSLSAAEVVAEQDADATPLNAEEMRVRDDYLRMQGLVGLMPEGYVAAELTADSFRNYVAFYSPESKGITLIRDRSGDDPASDYVILVHEVVHAYQDAAWDLTALEAAHAGTYDRFLGLRAFIEGYAVLYANFAYVELADLDVMEVDWDTYFDDWQDESRRRALASEVPALDTLSNFAYAFGGQFAFDAWLAGGEPQLADVSRRPPDSVRQVLAGFDTWPALFVNEDAALDPQAVAVLPANYTLLTGGHEGLWSINAMLQRTAAGGLWTEAIELVSADYLAAWRQDDGEVVAMWRIRTSWPDGLLAALQEAGTRWQPDDGSDVPTTHLVTTIDSDVLLIAVSDGDARSVLADIAGWQSVTDAFPSAAAGAPGDAGRLDRRRRGHRPHRHRPPIDALRAD